RRSASSAPCSAAGPTLPSTAPATNAAAPSPAGSTSTIDDDHTAASAAKPRSSAYTRSTGTTSSGPTDGLAGHVGRGHDRERPEVGPTGSGGPRQGRVCLRG